MANQSARVFHILQFGLAALLTIVGSERLTDLFFSRNGFQCQVSGPTYTQTTIHSSRIECSALCQRQNCAGMNFDKNSTLCTIYPSIDRVVIGPSNMYIRTGLIEQMLKEDGYLSLGGQRFVKIVQGSVDDSNAVNFCTTVFAFASLFVPKSESEMKLLGDFSIQNGTDNKEYFIGLGDADVEGIAKWSDGTAYNGLVSPMYWKGDTPLKDNTDVRDTVNTKLRTDKWETKFKENADGVICQVDLTR